MSASTPRRPSMSANNTPLASPGRRVLGDVTARAVNTPSKQTNNGRLFEEQRARSPLKQAQTYSPLGLEDKENALSGNAGKAIGRKRSIDEVEGTGYVACGGTTIMPTGVRNEAFPMTSKVRVLAETTPNLELANRRDSRGSTTEPESPPSMEQPSQETADTNRSFSNLVDWGECASQPTDAAVVETAPETKEPSKADLLRLRLGFATYKVKTNQISKPSKEILSTWDVEVETECPVSSTSTITPTTTVTAPGIPSITVSPARQNQPKPSSPLHVKANLDPGRPVAKLSAAPILLPTAYSSRMIYDYHANVPSSPPTHDVLPKCVSPEQVMSPTRPIYRTPAMRRIREDEYGDEDDGDDKEERRAGGGELTSSVVKGRAAMGLLELNSGRR
ncbi:uncharacterized protein EI97DRAFT_469360 [Westerdykella ornata]|uniref:Uncharacterized protein n=1 Tax=Westerdykella ornata TaxID=318751 RepID=A0A6A6JEM0_WESOR|nr:uncharacterized protein EI97DRAFT_469360 [Westerdykella ornata]KAF2273619.1 hypothetical protein EI97DRAFT_469360 [Westerdykella ornata]